MAPPLVTVRPAVALPAASGSAVGSNGREAAAALAVAAAGSAAGDCGGTEGLSAASANAALRAALRAGPEDGPDDGGDAAAAPASVWHRQVEIARSVPQPPVFRRWQTSQRPPGAGAPLCILIGVWPSLMSKASPVLTRRCRLWHARMSPATRLSTAAGMYPSGPTTVIGRVHGACRRYFGRLRPLLHVSELHRCVPDAPTENTCVPQGRGRLHAV